ncbi:response regulator [Roseomonas elaeocarpi]|uniref:histidine kinase n=1 Tax=Roseomonas elaeocarpi TaxID=907779 RepID=A0ABV6JRU0_9PROT
MSELILNVDDTEAGRYARTRTLERGGFAVIEARNGAETLQLVAERRPALVLLDVKLPDMDGHAVCAAIKRDHPRVLVLQTSASFIASDDRVRGLDGGADGYLSQPTPPQELLAAVRALLRIRRAEDATRLTEERYRLAQRATNDAIWDWDVVQNQVTWNDALQSLFGHAPGLTGHAGGWWLGQIHPDDRPRLERSIQDTLAGTASTWSDEYRFRRADGRYAEVHDRGYVLRDGAGRALRMIGAMADITERKRAEAEREALLLQLAQERARFATLFENVPVGVLLAEAPSGRIVLSNRRMSEIIRSPVPFSQRHEDYGEWQGWLPDGRPVTPGDWPLRHAVRGDSTTEEVLYLRGDGSRGWLRISGAPVRDAQTQEVVGGCVVVHDIDREKHNEAELLRFNQQLEALVAERTAERDRIWALSDDLLGVYEPGTGWRSVNPAWQRLLGWSEAEILSMAPGTLDHPEDQASWQAAFAHRPDAGAPLSHEGRLRAQDDGYRTVAWKAVAGQDGLIYAFGRDVSAEKAAQEALRRTEEQLRQSQKMEALGQLTGGIAHDFNNLLTGIVGSLELMGKRIAQNRVGELRRYMDAAMTSANRAAALTHRLLAFARRQSLAPRPTDVNALVQSVTELLHRTVGEKVRIETSLADDLWSTLCDPNQLENALLNLAINARDAMPDGGTLTITTGNIEVAGTAAPDAAGRHEQPGSYVSLSVADNGTGIPESVLDKVFDPFFTTKPLGKGTGLGLSMLYGFVAQSGGHVRLASTLGQGTTVTLLLPRHQGEELRTEAPGTLQPLAPGAGETVLVVEDEPSVRMLVLEVLRELGYVALEAGNAADALAILRSGAAIDLLLTDVGLPGGMNGPQLAEAVQQSHPGLRVLFVTGYAFDGTNGQSLLPPEAPRINKPFAMHELAARIREMMSSPPAA